MNNVASERDFRIPFGCRCGLWHRWTRWKDYNTGSETFFGTASSRPVLIQQRICVDCHAAARRLVRI